MAAVGLILLGAILGVFGTLVGAGGGFILMPVLVLMHPDTPASHLAAVSLAVVFFNALSGSLGYARLRRIDLRSAVIYAAAAVPGSIAGALATSHIPGRIFDIALGTTLVACAIVLLVRGKPDPEAVRTPHSSPARRWPIVPHTRRKRLLGIVTSFAVGFLSSVLGIGGGIVHVPALVFLLGFPVHVAAATSHFVLACTAGVGVAIHAASGDLRQGLSQTLEIALGAFVGAQLGAHLSIRVPGRLIVRILAVAVLVVGVRVAISGLERTAEADAMRPAPDLP